MDPGMMGRLWASIRAFICSPIAATKTFEGEGIQGDFGESPKIHEKSQPETGKGYGERQLL